jgi:iron complex transport system permease protein
MTVRRLLAALAVLVGLLFLASLLVGPADVAPLDGLSALVLGGEGPLPLVMREVRLPRAILAAMVGASLGLGGAALQGFLRNPLAEPGLIGVGPGAALGAVISLQTSLAAAVPLGLPAAALAGASLAVALLLVLSGPHGSSMTLILAGIAISSLASALTSLVLNLSPNPFAATEITFWLLGSLADRSFVHVGIALPFVAVGLWLMLGVGRGLDALTLGEDAAASLGIPLARLRLRLVLGLAAAVGASTAVAGSVGFVGLVVPHLLRARVGARPSALLPASALGGAAMVLASDIAVRLILPHRGLQLGVVTALVGAPLFLHLVFRTRREFR